jgi:Uma2 family endonuclease
MIETETRRMTVEDYRKRPAYARGGGRELWLVYPEARCVDIYRRAENSETPLRSYSLGETFRSPLFPGLEIQTNKIFAR